VMLDPLESVPFLSLLAKWRRRIAKEARSFAHLIELAHEVSTTFARLSPRGIELAKTTQRMDSAIGPGGLEGSPQGGPVLPSKADFPRQVKADVEDVLETARSRQLPVVTLVGASAGAARVRLFAIEGFQDRPKGRVVLALDLLTDSASVVELGLIRSAMMYPLPTGQH